MAILHSNRDREQFYAAAVVGLRALDARERAPRRFGRDADARWEQFRGSLGPSDRLDILLRDAAGTWGSAFSPAQSFGAFGLADDEPFGPDWRSLSDERANRLLLDSGSDLAALASALNVPTASLALPSISSATHVVAAGAQAVFALGSHFSSRPELAWSEQVVVVATTPTVRQLAGLVAVILGAQRRTVLVRPSEDPTGVLRAAGFPNVDVAVVSADADPESARFARATARS